MGTTRQTTPPRRLKLALAFEVGQMEGNLPGSPREKDGREALVFHCREQHVMSCKHGTQDVCTVNKVHKYHSMGKTVESVHTAVETQRRIFC
jgi:hypothetical protein